MDRLSWNKSSLFSSERTFESMSDGIAGLVGLALSLARILPRLPGFCHLSHRWRRRFARVASVGEAAVSEFGFSSRPRPYSFSVVTGESWCFLYALPISRRLWCFRVFIWWFWDKVRQFEDEEMSLTDVKTQFLGPGVAAGSDRADILVMNPSLTGLCCGRGHQNL